VSKRLLTGLSLALPLLGLAELAMHQHQRGRAPAFAAYAALTQPVEELASSGARVAVAPAWAEPLVHRAIPVTVSDAAAPDEDDAAHVVEVSMMGERDERFAGWPTLAKQSVGPFVVRRLENPVHRPSRFDFVDRLASPGVAVQSGTQPCRWTRGLVPVAGNLGGHPTFGMERFVCGPSVFFNVSETVIADEHFRPRRCIWAHPPASGALSIRYRDVTLGSRLVGHMGMYWIIERQLSGVPVELTITVDGAPIAKLAHHDGDGWSRFEVPLGERGNREGAEVTFDVRASDHRHRHFCFEARSQ
jgi:hypothetical protein